MGDEPQQQEFNRSLPSSELDLNIMLTDNNWGRDDVSPELKNHLKKYYVERNKEGQDEITEQSLWGLLAFYTRDIRLGNLSEWNGELKVTRFWLDFASELIFAGYVEPFIVALPKAITIIETSQSKNGFVRRNGNTLRQEHFNQNVEAPKKTFFGGPNKEGGM